jgi:cyclase
MIRRKVQSGACAIAIAAAVIFSGLTVNAQDEDYSKVRIKVTKVRANLYMVEGEEWEGGNIAALVGEDGIVIVDDQSAPLAERIQGVLSNLGVTDKPIRFVINTHYHEDHTGGNAYIQRQGLVIAQENVRKRLENGSMDGNGASEHFVKPQPKEALPIITFRDEITLHLNGDDIRALHLPAGHTDGDAVIFFRKANVVHLGDDFVTYGFPYIDLDGGGSINGLIDGLEKVIAQVPRDVRIIPGHGPVSSLADLQAYLKMLKEMRDTVAKALKEGKTFEQMKHAKILDPWKNVSGEFVTEDAFLETLYNSLTGHAIGEPIGHN